ncbi:hypothetical protein [Leifsonia sp. Leaf264]|uniref:hypothetical protein n=1 Tax=Leifsonia sp. Leaf264 TaxID=1736314 RepID=UPI000B32F726|nr:hypothetical protein [Leifsonia sp. Leaf264]
MQDLTGTATERLEQLARISSSERDRDWLDRQLTAALEGWQRSEDVVNEQREGHADY